MAKLKNNLSQPTALNSVPKIHFTGCTVQVELFLEICACRTVRLTGNLCPIILQRTTSIFMPSCLANCAVWSLYKLLQLMQYGLSLQYGPRFFADCLENHTHLHCIGMHASILDFCATLIYL